MSNASTEEIRKVFERVIPHQRVKQPVPLGIMEVNGSFSHYMDPETDTLFIGFTIGYNVHKRLREGK